MASDPTDGTAAPAGERDVFPGGAEPPADAAAGDAVRRRLSGGDRRDPAAEREASLATAGGRQPRGAEGARAPASVEDEIPRLRLTRREVVASALFVLLGVGFLYVVLPRLAGETAILRHLEAWERGNSWWLAIGVLLEVLSFAGYVLLFRAVFVRGTGVIGWRESYQISLAGLAATRLFATAGAGGVALTVWALRRSGMDARLVACRMVAFMVLLYSIYMGSLIVDGLALRTGLFPGGGSVRDHGHPGDRGRSRGSARWRDGAAAR